MRICAVLLSGMFFLVTNATAQQTAVDNKPSEPLIVAVKPAPPFVIKEENGTYSGISITLWEQIASHLAIEYRYREQDLQGLLDGMAENRFAVGVGALTITAERETRFDFSQPFFTSGLAIALNTEQTPGWWAVTKRFFSADFFSALAALFGVLLAAGFLVWLFERRANAEQFHQKPARGIGAGIWWAAVTMTTVGYGDKTPQTFGGRAIGLVWMFTAIIIIASFTASITSSLTVGQLSSRVNGPQDLPNVQVGSVPGSTSAAYLEDKGIAYHQFENLDEALNALAAGDITAVVYDAPLLRYQVKNRNGNLQVLATQFNYQDYGFALPENSNIREALNRKLLQITEEPTWNDTLQRYIGEPGK